MFSKLVFETLSLLELFSLQCQVPSLGADFQIGSSSITTPEASVHECHVAEGTEDLVLFHIGLLSLHLKVQNT